MVFCVCLLPVTMTACEGVVSLQQCEFTIEGISNKNPYQELDSTVLPRHYHQDLLTLREEGKGTHLAR